MIDLEKEIRQFLLSGRDDFDCLLTNGYIVNGCIAKKEINIITGYCKVKQELPH